jgi:DNA ligase (NAD+)
LTHSLVYGNVARMSKIVSARILELSNKIEQARKDYYNSTPTVSDRVYDAWFDELSKLDPSNPAVTAVGAPIQITEWKKVKHEQVMNSLNKVNSFDEFQIWAKECSAKKFLICDKLDGLSVSLKYENGKLVCGASRGNGEIGENITQNVRKMEGVQTKLTSKFNGHVRGEIVLRRSNHKKYFSEYANPRNAASGISKRLDGKGNEHLTVICYSIEGEDYDTEQELFKALDQMGFLTPTYKTGTLAEVLKTYEQYQDEIRDTLDYDIDGLVIRVDDRADQLALGEKNHRPKGAIAFKFDAALAETTIRNVIWQVGDTGRVTPVAEFDPVSLMGATVTRASLYNMAYVQELGLDIGATVLVKRANDVVPRCEELVKGTGKILSAPKKCPDCDGLLTNDGEYIRCTNSKECPSQVLGRINKWIKELGILEWGAKQIQKMIDAGLVVDVADIYRLKANDIAGLDKLGDKSAQNLIAELDKYREVTLENLIGGLTINGIATSSVKLVTAAGYDKLDDLFKITEAQLENIPGFGSIRAEAFVTGMAENRKRIEDILSAGVKIKAKVKGVLSGRSFCFTGTMSTPRAKLQKMVEDAGGDVKNSVGKGLSYLIIADPASTSSKAKAARKFGTVLLSEAEFAKLVSG